MDGSSSTMFRERKLLAGPVYQPGTSTLSAKRHKEQHERIKSTAP